LADEGAFEEAFALMDERSLSSKFHKTIAAELLNQRDGIKLPGLLKLASSEWHPFRSKALSLLGALENPKHLGTFLSHMNGEQGAVSFSASQALGRLLKARPELVTAEVEQRLNQVLGAKDEKDLSRLHLRQNLPEELVARLNKKLLEDQKVEPGRLDAVLERATQAALDLQKKEGMGLMGVGQRALAIEYLIRSGHPEAVEKASQFLETAFPKGYIHNINAIQGVIQASREAGIELPAATLEKIQARLEKDGRMLWNSGNPEMRKGEDSNLIPYGGAAYITTAPDPGQLNETQKQILDRLSQMKGKPVPYFFDSKDKSQEKGPLLDPAPTSGRTVTAALASYLTAPEGKKPDSAERLLTAARTFSDHFSQTHEIPISSERTHDRTPGAQQMAAYYGFANDPNLARALTLLSHDPSLSAEKRKEAQDLATQFQTRLLSLTESDGRIRQRQVESYPNENQVHQLFTGLTLLRLNRQTASPQARLLQKAK
ncbi:hypothetical protein EBT16_03140, partial [bacterium]|nr:hypothetical protein [bacterium]